MPWLRLLAFLPAFLSDGKSWPLAVTQGRHCAGKEGTHAFMSAACFLYAVKRAEREAEDFSLLSSVGAVRLLSVSAFVLEQPQ